MKISSNFIEIKNLKKLILNGYIKFAYMEYFNNLNLL